jgi:hypothetical protein
MHIRWLLIALLAVGPIGCDRSDDSVEYAQSDERNDPEDPRLPPEKLDLVDSFEIAGFTYGIDSVERSDVHAQFEDEETGEMEWVTIHYRLVNTSDKAMAPIVPDVIVETNGLKFRDPGGNAQIGDAAAKETGVSIGQLDELQPGETELNMAIFKIPDTHADKIKATFDFDGYNVPTDRPLEYQFTLNPKPGEQVLVEPEADAGDSGAVDQ